MDDELSPEEIHAAEDAETMVPRALMAGRMPEEVVADLMRLGWSRSAGMALVQRVMDDLRRFHESPETRQKLIGEARGQCIGGCVMMLLAAGGTLFTFLLAAVGATPYFIVAFGLFFVGVILAGRGWGRWQYYRKLIPQDDTKGNGR